MKMPRIVSIDITKQCNLRCLHCYNSSGEQDRNAMGDELLSRVTEQIAFMHPQTVCLCGGEPLLYSKIYDLMDILSRGAARISMVTNGLCINERTAKMLKEHGLDTVQVSLDGSQAWQHDSLRGTAGAFERAVNAIRRLKDAGIRQVSVSMLPDRLTLSAPETMEEYTELCCSLGVNAARFMPFISMGRGAGTGRSLQADQEQMFCFQKHLEKLRHRYAGRLVIEWDDPVRTCRHLCRKILEDQEYTALCVMNDGSVKPDIYLPVVLGNVRSASLKKICEDACRNEMIRKQLGQVLQSVHNLSDLEELKCSF